VIERQEFLDRMARLRRAVADAGLDAYVVSGEESIYYLTGVSYRGFERPFFILVRPEGKSALLVPAMEEVHLSAAPNVDQVHRYREYPAPPGHGWSEKLLDLLSGARNVGIEPSFPLEIAEKLAPASPKALPLLDRLRRVKSPAELEMIRAAARFSDSAVKRIMAASYYGVSVLELFAQGRAVQLDIMKSGPFDVLATSVLVGSWPAPLSAQPHGVPGLSDRLREGPHISLAFLRVNGYAAECERTYFTAPATSEEEAAFDAMQEARRRAFALVRPGTPCAELDHATRSFLHDEGYGENLLHRTGHGFGLGNHEPPWVGEGSPDVLEENMVISIEPGIYVPKVGGFRHSDTVLVTRDGFESLTRYPMDLASLTISGSKRLTRLRGAVVRRAAGVT
jgi:Xaa-Pro dipeptidase